MTCSSRSSAFIFTINLKHKCFYVDNSMENNVTYLIEILTLEMNLHLHIMHAISIIIIKVYFCLILFENKSTTTTTTSKFKVSL